MVSFDEWCDEDIDGFMAGPGILLVGKRLGFDYSPEYATSDLMINASGVMDSSDDWVEASAEQQCME